MFLTIIKLTLDLLTLILATQSINHKWRRFKHRLYLHGLIDWPYHPSCQRQVFAAVRHIDEESEDEEESSAATSLNSKSLTQQQVSI